MTCIAGVTALMEEEVRTECLAAATLPLLPVLMRRDTMLPRAEPANVCRRGLLQAMPRFSRPSLWP